MTDWASLYDTLCGEDTEARKPTSKDLDQFEKSLSFKLPLSYRSFIQMFGPGRMTRAYDIASPGFPESGDSVDLLLLNQTTQEVFTREENRKLYSADQLAWIQRLVYFCAQRNGDLIGWDPHDIQDPTCNEYGVYLFGRSDWMKRIALSFEQFIAEVCLSKEHLNNPHWDEEELGPLLTFDPAE